MEYLLDEVKEIRTNYQKLFEDPTKEIHALIFVKMTKVLLVAIKKLYQMKLMGHLNIQVTRSFKKCISLLRAYAEVIINFPAQPKLPYPN